jgi:hypothetical protein
MISPSLTEAVQVSINFNFFGNFANIVYVDGAKLVVPINFKQRNVRLAVNLWFKEL